MNLLYFLVCVLSSIVGAISGIGGGVIIKPVLDSLGTLDGAAIRFLSGNVVLCMAASTLLRNRGGKVQVRSGTSSYLALGACMGGIAGKELFGLLGQRFGSPILLGIIQSALLLLIHVGVLLYLKNKHRIRTLQVTSPVLCAVIGLLMGTLSSFLGIGGGPINIAVISFFFSLQSKETALNSLYVIFFSQLTSLCATLLTRSVPDFSWATLLVMCLGGVGGALIGSRLSRGMSHGGVEKLFQLVMGLLILLNLYNIAVPILALG